MALKSQYKDMKLNQKLNTSELKQNNAKEVVAGFVGKHARRKQQEHWRNRYRYQGETKQSARCHGAQFSQSGKHNDEANAKIAAATRGLMAMKGF